VKVRRWRIALVESMVVENTEAIWTRLLNRGGEVATVYVVSLSGVRRWLSMTKGASRGEFALEAVSVELFVAGVNVSQREIAVLWSSLQMRAGRHLYVYAGS
jgi:hypothetical protein